MRRGLVIPQTTLLARSGRVCPASGFALLRSPLQPRPRRCAARQPSGASMGNVSSGGTSLT